MASVEAQKIKFIYVSAIAGKSADNCQQMCLQLPADMLAVAGSGADSCQQFMKRYVSSANASKCVCTAVCFLPLWRVAPYAAASPFCVANYWKKQVYPTPRADSVG